jgi:hypothetical protein
MQILNVGAGRTDNEYKADEEQRRAGLRADSREDANYFFWAAGLAAISSGLLPVMRVNFLINIGAFDLLSAYGGSLDQLHPLVLYSAVVVTSLAGCPGRTGICRTQRPALGISGGHTSVRGGHDRPHGHVFIVGVWGPCLLRFQMVPRTKSIERPQRSGRLDPLKTFTSLQFVAGMGFLL